MATSPCSWKPATAAERLRQTAVPRPEDLQLEAGRGAGAQESAAAGMGGGGAGRHLDLQEPRQRPVRHPRSRSAAASTTSSWARSQRHPHVLHNAFVQAYSPRLEDLKPAAATARTNADKARLLDVSSAAPDRRMSERPWRVAALHVIVLAAGAGTRMKSRRAKVLMPLAGRPLLAHVIDGGPRTGAGGHPRRPRPWRRPGAGRLRRPGATCTGCCRPSGSAPATPWSRRLRAGARRRAGAGAVRRRAADPGRRPCSQLVDADGDSQPADHPAGRPDGYGRVMRDGNGEVRAGGGGEGCQRRAARGEPGQHRHPGGRRRRRCGAGSARSTATTRRASITSPTSSRWPRTKTVPALSVECADPAEAAGANDAVAAGRAGGASIAGGPRTP